MTNLNNYNTNISIPDNSDYRAELALMDHLNHNRVHQDFRTDKLPDRRFDAQLIEQPENYSQNLFGHVYVQPSNDEPSFIETFRHQE